MTWNGLEQDRIERIEKRLDELDARTCGLVRLGPQEPSEEERKVAAKHVAEMLITVANAVADAAPPVDRSAQQLTDGSPVTADHREIQANGMQKDYVVLTPDERAKGFVRPVRRTYVHKTCGVSTSMSLAIAETYARDPKFYNGTFCCGCNKHFPLDQFVWKGTDEQVGN